MKEFIDSIPEGVWQAIHFSIVVPLTFWINTKLKVGGLLFGRFSPKQLVSFAASMVIGYLAWGVGVGAIAKDSAFLVGLHSFYMALASNGVFDMFSKKRV